MTAKMPDGTKLFDALRVELKWREKNSKNINAMLTLHRKPKIHSKKH